MSAAVGSEQIESEQNVAEQSRTDEGTAPATAPQIQVVHGNPTPEELAAVVTVLAAISVAATQSRSDNDQRRTPVIGGWTARERGVRTPPHSGPGGWRASAFPPAR